jgi:high frequency lysogenization protein
MDGPPSHLDRVMALAGLYQATALVKQVAHAGTVEAAPFEASIASVLCLDAASTEEVFGGWEHLGIGLETLCRQLGRRGGKDTELTRYAVCLLFLERKLKRRQDLRQEILQGIRKAQPQASYFCPTHESVLANLAEIYTSTISTLSPRIMVTGSPAYLSNPSYANRIRALLLAGLRATVLWRQLGGRRLHLLFSRADILAAARAKLDTLAMDPGRRRVADGKAR